jgi:hypothetical protein
LIKYRIDAAAVQEIRWKLTEIKSLKKYRLLTVEEKKHDHCMVFVVRKSCKPNIMEYKLINERIRMLIGEDFLTQLVYK